MKENMIHKLSDLKVGDHVLTKTNKWGMVTMIDKASEVVSIYLFHDDQTVNDSKIQNIRSLLSGQNLKDMGLTMCYLCHNNDGMFHID